MKKIMAKIVGFVASVAMIVGVGFAAAKNTNNPVYASPTTYQHVFNAKPATGASVSLSSVNWKITATNLNNYNSANYAGVQVGTGSKTGDFEIETVNAWGGQSGTYYGKGKVTEIRLWLNAGTTTTLSTLTASVGGVACTPDKTTVTKNSSAAADWSKTTKITFTVGATDTGKINIHVAHSSNLAFYVCCLEIDCEESSTPSSSSDSSSSEIPASSSSEIPANYTVTYDANGATSGSVPTDSNEYNNGASVTVLDNSGSLVKTGYVFGGWNTAANGSGTSYSAGDTFDISTNTSLYARWFANHSSDNEVIVTAPYLNLNNTGISSAATLTATDGMQYMAAPNGSNTYVKATAINGKAENNFNSDSPVLMGKEGAYLYNKDPFQKNIAKIEIYIHKGASASAAVAINFSASAACTASYTDDSQLLNPDDAIYTFTANVANAKYFRIQVTAAVNVQIQAKIKFAIPTTSVTVTPESVSLTPTATQQLTTVVEPANTTDSLVYSSSDEDVATVSEDGLITAVDEGTAIITATSGSYSDTCEVTVANVPYIVLSKNSTSGYTGQHETLSFTYGYLTGSLSVISSDEDVVTVEDPSASAGSGTVQINFVGAGSTTVKFKDGSTEKASVTVSVTQTTVSLNKTSFSLHQSRSEELIATTNVGGVEWSSNNAKVTVDDGLVEVAADAVPGSTAVITATSTVDDSVSATCTVTVLEHPLADFLDDSVIPAAAVGANGTTWGTASTFSDYTGAVYTARFMGAASSSFIGRLNDSNNGYIYTSTIPTGMKLKSVSISSVADGKTVGVYTKSTAYTEGPSSKSEAVGTITSSSLTYNFDGNPNNKAIFLRGHTAATDIGEVTITYEELTTSEVIETTVYTQAMLSYNYNKLGDDSFEFSNVVIRFNGFIDTDLWDELDGNDDNILGYGFLLRTTDPLDEKSLKQYFYEAYEDNSSDFTNTIAAFGHDELSSIKAFYANLAGNPATATDDQKIELGILDANDYYIWNLRKNVSTSDLTTDFTAVAFIRTKTGVVFLQEKTTNVAEIAFNLIDTGIYSDGAFDDSLLHLGCL